MAKKIFLRLIRYYQTLISPFLGRHCRFYPTCSEYAYISIREYGLLKGLSKGVFRILRCSPLSKGGIDKP